MTLSQDQDLKQSATEGGPDTPDPRAASIETEAGAEGAPAHEGLSPGAAREAAEEPNPAVAELADLNDKHLRLLAEFDNYRRRTAREHADLVATANAKLLGKLTEVLDNFARAFDPQNASASAEDFEKGVRLIYNRFQSILEEEGLESVDPAGGEFDPNLHEALLQQVSDSVPENGILQVVQRGYKVKGRILKHAKVIVSKGSE